MIIKETLSITMRKDVTCKAGVSVIELSKKQGKRKKSL